MTAIRIASTLTSVASKAFFFNKHAHLRVFAGAKLFCGRHTASPNHLPGAFKNRPTNALLTGDSPYLEHLLELSALSVAARSVGIARPPISEKQRRAKCSGVKRAAVGFSVALPQGPVNYFQVEAG